jgi:hypothetical protein
MAGTVNDISSTTQQYLSIHDVSNDILILKDCSTALILAVSAMNFGLLAEPEQDAIMYAYAGLLNSLNYPIQIVIRSQTKDVTNYLELLKDEEDSATSDSKRNWIARYRQFVGELIKERNVLDKKFYVSIPATSLEMGLLPPSTVLPGVSQIDISKIERSVILEKAREILEPKRDYLMQQFGRIGLQSRQLKTQEIIQLFYLSYNPEAAEGQQITDTNSYTTPLVSAGMQGGIMMDNVAALQNTPNNQGAQAWQAPAQPATQPAPQAVPQVASQAAVPEAVPQVASQAAVPEVAPKVVADITMPQNQNLQNTQVNQPEQQPSTQHVKPEPAIHVVAQPSIQNLETPIELPGQPTVVTPAVTPTVAPATTPTVTPTVAPATTPAVAPEDVIATTNTTSTSTPQSSGLEDVSPEENVEIQNEINSTLKELGGVVSTAGAGTSALPATPSSIPLQPMVGTNQSQQTAKPGQASVNSVPPITTPNTTNIPDASGAGSSSSNAAPADATKDNLQPLPEI